MIVFEMTSVGWFSSEMVVSCNDSIRASLNFGGWENAGRISLVGEIYQIRKSSFWRSELNLMSGETVLLQTKIRGVLRPEADFTFNNVAYTARWSGWGSQVTLMSESKEIGVVESKELFSRRVRAKFREELPELLSVFVLWLAAYKRNIDSSAAAG